MGSKSTQKSSLFHGDGPIETELLDEQAQLFELFLISACRVARVRKLEATRARSVTNRELIVAATMILRMIGTPVFSDRTEFSVTTTGKQGHGKANATN